MADNIEIVEIAGGADITVIGNDQANIMKGNRGANILDGRDGADRLIGGAGADTLKGGLGADLIFAGVDSDRDVIVFSNVLDSRPGAARDQIREFDPTRDKIDLRGLDAVWGGTDDAFRLTAGPARNAVWLIDTAAGTVLRADLNGDLRHDFEVLVVGVTGIGDSLLL